jgi:phosphoglucosamine mutase
VLAILVREQLPISELAMVMQRVPQLTESVNLPDRRPIDQMPKLSQLIRMAESSLAGEGRVLVRWSGTEPKLRFMVEGPDPARLQSMVRDMADAARADLGAKA